MDLPQVGITHLIEVGEVGVQLWPAIWHVQLWLAEPLRWHEVSAVAALNQVANLLVDLAQVLGHVLP